MRRHRNRVDPVAGMEIGQMSQEEIPMPVEVEMRPGRAGQDLVRAGHHVDLGQRRAVDKRQLGIGLADIDDGDTGHGRWNIGISGTATGSLSGCVCIRSAICAHHLRITGCDGRSSMP